MTNNLQPKVTLMIKTFNRKNSLIRLLRSLNKMTISFPILIADDSKKPYKEEILLLFKKMNIEYHVLPFDSGLSAGRNFLLRRVKTPFLILCDDDFVFDKRADVENALDLLIKLQYDILGGSFYNYICVENINDLFALFLKPKKILRYFFSIPKVSRYIGRFHVTDNYCKLEITNKKTNDLILNADVLNNFFIARTNSLKQLNGWDEKFKLGEHEDFFYRAKLQGFKIGFYSRFGIRHYPVMNKNYQLFRQRSMEFKKEFPKKFGFEKYVEINIDKNEVLFSYSTYEQNSIIPL